MGTQSPGDQLRLPLGKPKAPPEVQSVVLGRRVLDVRFVPHKRARHYVARLLPDGSVRLTVPRYGSRAGALAFLRRELRWVDRQRYAAARNDAVVLFRGCLLPLTVDRTSAGDVVRFGDERVVRRAHETARRAACRHLRGLAAGELPGRLRELAQTLRLEVARVVIRDQQTRWGSCSPGGTVSLNWRLVQMPDAVRDYVLIHELVHLREGGHGRRFWRLVEEACPAHREARRWLKAHQSELA